MTVDLRTCVPGQLVELRNGNIVRYGYRSKDLNTYPHRVKDSFYTNDGHYFLSGEEDDEDVVKILQLDKPEQPKSDAHPSIAWWESCPWITDRLPTVDDTPQGNTDKGMVLVDRYYGIAHKHYTNVTMNERWIHVCTWEPHNQTPKQKALALIAKHKDSSTVGVWVPTPDEWDIIREGLTE